LAGRDNPCCKFRKNACDRIVRCDMFFLNEQAMGELPGVSSDRSRRRATRWSPGGR
jgi:hypothetical protein